MNQRDCNHVLDAVVAIGRIVERTGFVDDAYRGLLRFDGDLFYVVEPVFHIAVQFHCRLDRSLGMKLSRIGDLEQDVFHHIAVIALREVECSSIEQDVGETPGLRRQCRWVTHLTGHRDQRQTHGTTGCIAGRPTLARTGVRGVSVGTQRATVDPRIRHRIDYLFPVTA